MKKLILILALILLISPLYAEEIDPDKKYIVKGEQILRWQKHILSLQQYVNNLTFILNEKELEILALKSEIEEWKAKYDRSRKEFWTGLGSGYPLGAQGIALYQFNERIGIFLIGGYSDLWTINVGFIAKISK